MTVRQSLKRCTKWVVQHVFQTAIAIAVGVAVTITVPVVVKNCNSESIVISSVCFNGPGDELDAIDGEWVEISNRGNSDKELSGWLLCDRDGHSFEFPPKFILDAGESVTIHTGSGDNSETDIYWRRGVSVWNNEGDTASLYDPDHNLVDQWSSW